MGTSPVECSEERLIPSRGGTVVDAMAIAGTLNTCGGGGESGEERALPAGWRRVGGGGVRLALESRPLRSHGGIDLGFPGAGPNTSDMSSAMPPDFAEATGAGGGGVDAVAVAGAEGGGGTNAEGGGGTLMWWRGEPTGWM